MIVYCLLGVVIIILLIYIWTKVTRGECGCSAHLINKVVIVTGANSGLGFEVAKDMAERGARVIVACRNEQRGLNAVASIKNISNNDDVHYRHLDLASFKSIRKFSAEILETEKRLDILINNAGTNRGAGRKTEDGYSLMIQSNYFGPFLLTSLLLPLLKTSAPSRIINVSSMTHRLTFRLDPNKLCEVPEKINCFSNSFCYFKTKLCINLMTFELARQLKGTGVTVNCVHPGAARTSIIDNIDIPLLVYLLRLLFPLFKTAKEGAETINYMAVSPDLINSSGGYYSDCKLTNPSQLSKNVELAQKIWEVTKNAVS